MKTLVGFVLTPLGYVVATAKRCPLGPEAGAKFTLGDTSGTDTSG